MLDKILANPFYSKLYAKTQSIQSCVDAGFFNDGLNKIDYDFKCTPTHKVKDFGVVLVTTGSFSPIHAGHLGMMEAAKRYLEREQRLVVAGGYISLSHDNYVSMKRPNTLEVEQRTALAQEAVANSDWLMVDPWEGMYTPGSINFTDVLTRLHKITGHTIVYVFGSDNAKFADAFVGQNPNKFMSLCVSRLGFDKEITGWSCSNIYSQPISSRDIDHKTTPPISGRYLLRDDFGYATRNWSCDHLRHQFVSELTSAISIASGCAVSVLRAEDQQESFNTIKTRSTISFDVWLQNVDHKIDITREFDPCGEQVYSRKIPRSLSCPIQTQINRIPFGEYDLIDDDIITGSTMDLFGKYSRYDIIQKLSLTQLMGHSTYHDVVDVRDFIFGSQYSGLTTKYGRVPYILPYVNLSTRMKVLPGKQLKFTKKILELNLDLFGHVPIEKCSQSFQDFIDWWIDQHFSTIGAFCEWHLKKLNGYNKNDSGF